MVRAAASNVDSDPAPGQPQDSQSAPTSIPTPVPEPIAAAVEARTPQSATVSAVSSIEDRIARQKADYKALNHAYERVRDAGSAASARTIALTAELAAIRTALEAEQDRARAADQALADSIAFGEAARVRGDEARRESERLQMELRGVRDSLAARDATIEQLRLSLGEREDRLAALQADTATRMSAIDARASVGTQIEADLRAERARSATLGAELADARTALQAAQNKVRDADKASRARGAALAADLASTHAALELAHSKSRETRKALAERIAAEEAAQSQGEEALRKSESYRAELSRVRDLLATRQQEHTKAVAALEARTKTLEAQVRAAETRVDAGKWESNPNPEITVAIDPPRERVAAPPAADRIAAATQWESGTAATIARFNAAETAPVVAPKFMGAAQFSEFPLFGSRGRWTTVARVAGVSVAPVLLAVVAWIFVHHAPVSENVPAGASVVAPQPGAVIRDCATCPALTVVPAGRFKQGSDRPEGNSAAFEKPPHWVLIGRPFAISTNAVTVDEFREFIAATGRDMRGCDTYEDKWRLRPEASWENPGFVQTGSHPVTCASWDDAKAYAGWLSRTTGHRYRLPSAAEWEYAARAGGEAVRPWDPDGSGACASANVADQRAARRYPGWAVFPCDDGYVYTAPVGSFKANSFGLNDTLGNVFQWTDDCWHADYTGVPTDGSSRTYGDCTERELRGGSWFTTPEFVRASYRNHFGVNYRASSVGIRLVRDIAP